ncbi:D-lyxose/D-mannose family sugar isomerase [Sulfitobacter sp. D35]|uniref:D-lyxose/D-mannose family sugar isomerase n=1 Tax=Sulfitobacter sp. D35 TaxID=3083252 RepID=UPI00296FFA95|nr:D-lyxose/D-mannose family sugar isomerase [Sulfitobacter sp. D35]MDW4498953.1 D-lyxose/D-mannose family sugar isomerase [Sulfitobacter sp. D35]
MDRSQVNEILKEGDAFFRKHGFILPPYAYWSPERIRGAEAETIRERGLGWDITDYGQGRFDEMGLFLFTTRNGLQSDLDAGRGMVYAEKIMISRENQLSPMHRHIVKTEDIINRGGGALIIELFNSAPDGSVDREAEITVQCDGVPVTLQAGGHLRLDPGASVTLVPGDWHAFWAEGGDCLIGEVSTVNDDRTDNIFEMEIGRFSDITEDVDPVHLLVSDY